MKKRKLKAILKRIEALEGQSPISLKLRDSIGSIQLQLEMEREMRQKAEIEVADLREKLGNIYIETANPVGTSSDYAHALNGTHK